MKAALYVGESDAQLHKNQIINQWFGFPGEKESTGQCNQIVVLLVFDG
jgi:hypothetical protein